jgi:hypothetical protein
MRLRYRPSSLYVVWTFGTTASFQHHPVRHSWSQHPSHKTSLTPAVLGESPALSAQAPSLRRHLLERDPRDHKPLSSPSAASLALFEHNDSNRPASITRPRALLLTETASVHCPPCEEPLSWGCTKVAFATTDSAGVSKLAKGHTKAPFSQ